MVPSDILPKFAALLYYDTRPAKGPGGRPAKLPVSFETLSQDEQEPFLEQAGKVFLMLDKLNLEAVPKRNRFTEDEALRLEKQRLLNVLTTFFDSITVWKRQHIPVEELAQRILTHG